ncbi:hypothetical protein H0B56_20345 [Haloechinothrix sp. YIM 98757]|uniref:Uncharacterized protein n=1 Tax=Haloechinothrix aidingensis TaxID=2752311 RepID=A0A838AF72_9PSEU|nr:hypothetical protein [Haloechinothrix aidingensis]MBA0127903.1 hypothetical protein [Haloechinothrix aidingensis]
MAKRTARIGALGAAAAMTLGGLMFVSSAQAQEAEGAGVSFFGHYCGLENYGSASECTYTPLLDQSYAGNGPFTIKAVDTAGDVVFETSCAEGELCTDESAGSIPAGSTVTIDVTGEPGSVGAGDFE